MIWVTLCLAKISKCLSGWGLYFFHNSCLAFRTLVFINVDSGQKPRAKKTVPCQNDSEYSAPFSGEKAGIL
jgi:hypothetical protein